MWWFFLHHFLFKNRLTALMFSAPLAAYSCSCPFCCLSPVSVSLLLCFSLNSSALARWSIDFIDYGTVEVEVEVKAAQCCLFISWHLPQHMINYKLCPQPPHSPLHLPLSLVSLSSLPTPPPLLLSLIIKSNKLFSIDLLAASNKQHPRNGADPEAAPLFPLLHSPPSTCRGCWLTTHWEHLMCNNDLYLGTQSARCWNSLCQSRRSGLSRLGGNASTSLIIRMWIFLFGFSHTYTRAHAHIPPLRGK